MPLGGVLISDRLMEEIKSEKNSSVMFSNGFTYSSHPVSCAAALKNIEIMERENIFGHAVCGSYFQTGSKICGI